MSSEPRKRTEGTGGDPRRYTPTQVTRCTECNASVLYMWLELHPRKWRVVMQPCDHVTQEQITRWRYTKRRDRHTLQLSIGLRDLGPSVERPPAPGFGSVAPPKRRRSPSHRG